MPGKVITAVTHKMASKAEHVGWHLACKIFFQAALHIIHGHQGNTIPEVISSATLHWDNIFKLFKKDRHFLHPTMSEMVLPAVKFIKLKPAKVPTDPGIPKLPIAHTASTAIERSQNAQNGVDPKRGKTGGRKKSGGICGDDDS